MEHILRRRRHQKKSLYMYQGLVCPNPKYLNLLTWKERGEGEDRSKLLVSQDLLLQSDGAVPTEAEISVNRKNSVQK